MFEKVLIFTDFSNYAKNVIKCIAASLDDWTAVNDNPIDQ
jgi:hypothetical protein